MAETVSKQNKAQKPAASKKLTRLAKINTDWKWKDGKWYSRKKESVSKQEHLYNIQHNTLQDKISQKKQGRSLQIGRGNNSSRRYNHGIYIYIYIHWLLEHSIL
jgi:hypothetical protein